MQDRSARVLRAAGVTLTEVEAVRPPMIAVVATSAVSRSAGALNLQPSAAGPCAYGSIVSEISRIAPTARA
jgi:hypothetical protein